MGNFSFFNFATLFQPHGDPLTVRLLCETDLGADDPSVALSVEEVVEAGLVLVRRAPVVVDGVEVVHAHLVGLDRDTFQMMNKKLRALTETC